MSNKIAIALLTSVAVAVAGVATNASAASHGGGGGGGGHGGGSGGGGFHGGGGSFGGFHAGGGGFHGFTSRGVSAYAAHPSARTFSSHASAHTAVSHGNLSNAAVHGTAAGATGALAAHALATHNVNAAAANHLTGTQFAHNQFAARNFEGLHNFNRTGFNRNAFGDPHHWNHWGHYFWGAGWNNWGWGWGGWAGPVFWPFLYGDIFSYLFWPYAYYDPFWAYGADYILGSIFAPGPYFGMASGYGPDYYGYDGSANVYYGGGPAPSLTNADQADLAAVNTAATQSCGGMAPGVNDLPIAQIRQSIHPTPEQTALLDDLNAASVKANGVVAASCPSDLPLTPVARLDAAKQRITAMIDAVQTVRTPLEKFYASLSDQQRQLFDKVGASEGTASAANADPQKLCGDQSSTTDVPVQRIEQVVQPNAQQQEAFAGLKAAAANAAAQLKASCPTATPLTPEARLDATAARLAAIATAMDTVRPALETFYASLSDEQKAKFNTMGPPPKTAAATPQSSVQ